MQAVSRVMKGWQEDAEMGTDRRSWRWLLEGDTNADGYDAHGEPFCAWGFLRLASIAAAPAKARRARTSTSTASASASGATAKSEPFSRDTRIRSGYATFPCQIPARIA